MSRFIFLILFIVLIFINGCGLTGIRHKDLPGEVSYSHAEVAEKLRKQGKYQAAIEQYHRHIEARLVAKNRREDENPHFYYLLIGESYLRMQELELAEKSYTTALKNNVHATLVADGFRQIAYELEKLEKYDEAIDILRKHRELDDLLYDAQMDRIHKKSVYQADQQPE